VLADRVLEVSVSHEKLEVTSALWRLVVVAATQSNQMLEERVAVDPHCSCALTCKPSLDFLQQ
jgi:hypothetical protein